MKKMKESRSSGMPMLEIVLSIGIFSIISVFILQLFLSANSLERKAKDISKAVICAENIAEVMKSYGSLEAGMEYLKFSKHSGFLEKELDEKWKEKEVTYYSVSYDQDWKVLDGDGTYEVVVVEDISNADAGTMTYAYIYIYRTRDYNLINKSTQNKELYSMKTAVYLRSR